MPFQNKRVLIFGTYLRGFLIQYFEQNKMLLLLEETSFFQTESSEILNLSYLLYKLLLLDCKIKVNGSSSGIALVLPPTAIEFATLQLNPDLTLFDGILTVQEWRNGSWGDNQPSDLRIAQSKSEGTTTLSVRTKFPDFLNLLHDFSWFFVVVSYSIWLVSSTFYTITLPGKISMEITFVTLLTNKAIF